jgi:hypothetical protein
MLEVDDISPSGRSGRMERGRLGRQPGRRAHFADRLSRQLWIGACLAGLGCALVMVWIQFTLAHPAMLHQKLLALAAIVGVFAAFLAVQAARWRAALRLARQHGGQLCPCCLYVLGVDMPQEGGRCTECGEPLTPELLRSAWDRRHRP